MALVANRWERWLRLAQFGGATWALVVATVGTVLPQFAYSKDILIDYMTARALREGLPLFTPASELQLRYFPNTAPAFLPYANMHPPTLWLLHLPLTYVPAELVTVLWLALSVAMLVRVALWLRFSWHGALALAIWPPVFWHLWLAQYEILILFLAMLAWRSAAAGKDWRAGLLLGFAGGLKFYPALFLVPFLFRRRWKVVAGGAISLVCGGLLSLLTIGIDGARFYFEGMSGVERQVILQNWGNSSPYVALLRCLGGTPIPPLVDAPHLVLPAALILVLVGVAALFWLPPAAAPAAVLVFMPTSMWYCSVLLLPQIVQTLRIQSVRLVAVVAGILISLPYPLVANVFGAPSAEGLLPIWLTNVVYSFQALGYVVLLVLSLYLAWQQSRGTQ